MSNILKSVLGNFLSIIADVLSLYDQWKQMQKAVLGVTCKGKPWPHQFNRHYLTFSVLNSISSDTEQFCKDTYLFAPLYSLCYCTLYSRSVFPPEVGAATTSGKVLAKQPWAALCSLLQPESNSEKQQMYFYIY